MKRYEKLGLSEEEKQELLAYDKAVEATKDKDASLDYDLSAEKNKVAQTFVKTGTRKTPTNYKFSSRPRKADVTKEGIIEELKRFLEENTTFSAENVEIINKSRQIKFSVGDSTFDLTLSRKTKK